MKKRISVHSLNRRISAIVAAVGLLASTGYGQATSVQEEVVELNPFIVDDSNDTGYTSNNSTSATRLDEQIKDLPMNIQALNSDFMDDVGALDVVQALDYVPSAEFTDNALEREINFRGLNSRFARRNQFVWYNPTDNYSTQRIEVVRGPQSLLYGQAEPGGLVNTITKKPIIGKNNYSVRLRLDDWGTWRGEFDANLGALGDQDRFGFRVAGLSENRQSWRGDDERKQNAIYATANFRITDTLEARVEYEDGSIDYDHRLLNIEKYNGEYLTNAIGPDGEPLLGTVTTEEELGLWSGSDDVLNRDYANIAVYLEGTALDQNFNYQLIFNQQEQSQYLQTVQGSNNIRFGNFTDFATGQSYTDAFYVQTQKQIGQNGNTVTNYRATAAYKFEVANTRQEIIAGYDHRIDEFYLENFQERNNPNPRGGARFAYRWALENGNDYSAGSPFEMPQDTYTFKPSFSIFNEGTTDAYFVALSSAFLDERLKSVIGWRRDDYVKIDTANDTVQDENAIDSISAGFTFSINDQVNFYANYSESFKAPGAFRRDPDNNVLPPAIGSGYEFGLKFDTAEQKLSGTFAIYSMAFDDDQVNIGGNSADRNAIDPNGLNGRNGSNWMAMDTGGSGAELQFSANPTPNWRIMFGYGYIHTAEVTKTFGMQANFNDSFLTGTDGNPVDADGNPIPFGEGFATIDDVQFTSDGTVVLNAGTGEGEIDLVGNGETGLKANPYTDQAMPFVTIREEGEPTDPWAKHNYNLTAKYTWLDGGAKGLSLGGSIRTRLDNYSGMGGRVETGDREVLSNPSYSVFDIVAGYRFNFDKVTWDIQLNILNVLDEEYFTGRYKTRYGNKRQFVLTNTLRF